MAASCRGACGWCLLGRPEDATRPCTGFTGARLRAATWNLRARDHRCQPQLRHIRSPRRGHLPDRGASVQIVRNDVVETRTVRIGFHSDDDIEIRNGLREGDLVVANAGSSLRDGDKVKPIADAAR